MSKISYYIAIRAAGKANEADARAEGLLVSAFGTKRTFAVGGSMSATGPKADIFLLAAMGSGASEGDCRALPRGEPSWIE